MENSCVICTSLSASRMRKGGRVVEGAPLERVYAGNRIESSNLSLSAIICVLVDHESIRRSAG